MTTYVARVTANGDLRTRARSPLVTPLLFLALTTSFASSHAVAAPMFTAPWLSYEVGRSPTAAAVGDVNGDGRPDLAVPNYNAGTVSLLLGRCDGTFAARVAYSTSAYPGVVAIADLNADGLGDVVVGSLGLRLSLLPGGSDGTLGPLTFVALAGNPRSMAVADFDTDGKPDVVVGCDGSVVSVLMGNGTGGFRSRTDLAGVTVTTVAVGDLTGDGRLDIAVANDWASFPNVLSIFPGNGNGSFGTRTDVTVFGGLNSVAIGDLNVDGKADLVVASAYTDSVSVLIGTGGGGFAAGPEYGVGLGSKPIEVALRDLDGDSRLDLVVANNLSSYVSVLKGNGDGSFATRADFAAGYCVSPMGMCVADVNSDGNVDLVVARQEDANPSTAAVLLGNGDGTFGTNTVFGTGLSPHSVAIADLNADGRLDLAVTATSGAGVSVLLGNGDGTFGPKSDFGTGSVAWEVAIADVNADGRPDLAVANLSGKTVSVLLGNGDGTFGPKTDYPGSSSVAFADLNADGRPDLVTANYYSSSGSGSGSTVSVMLGNGDGTFGPKTDFGTGTGPFSVAIADLNSDGRPDLAVTNYGLNGVGNTVSVLLGNGDGTFGPKTDLSTGNGPDKVAIADLNGDGRPDLAVSNYLSSTLSVLLGNGDGTFGNRTDFATGTKPQSVVIRDLNADGRPDLTVANFDGNSVSVLLGNGDGTFGPKTDFGTGVNPASVAIGDLNADGRPDLAVANYGSNTVSALLHTATPPLAIPDDRPGLGEIALNLLAPNPARTASQIQYTVARSGHVRLEVADIAGRVVATLFDGVQPPGRFQLAWDGTNRGERLPAGLYFVRLRTLDQTVARKITRLP